MIGLELVVQADGKWTPFPLWSDDDPGSWCELAVDALAERRGVRLALDERQVVVQTWAAMVEHARASREDGDRLVSAAYAFVPMGSATAMDLVPWAVASLTGLSGGQTRDRVVDELVQPPALRLSPPIVDELTTESGTALRMRQLLREPVTTGPNQVAASLVYVWDTPVDGTVVTLDAWFGSPTEAALVEPSFDALAASLEIRVET